MARVVVIGGGFAGMASAARLAKLGHEVTLVEQMSQLGGAMGVVEKDGFTWDAGPSATLLPAVVRDLFRKTGRPLEREVDLVQQPIIRTHHFEDDTTVALPGSSRAAQIEALDGLGAGLGDQWAAYVEGFADDWEMIRRDFLERPWIPEIAAKETTSRIFTRDMLAKRLKKSFKDDRLRLLAAHPFVFEGHDARDVPAWMGMVSYVEQRFGAWTIDGGLGRLSGVLAQRLATRKVTVLLDTAVTDIVVREGRAVAVSTSAGEIDADVVVCASDPRRLPTMAERVRRTMPAIPPVVCHLGLTGDVPDLPPESVFHGDPMIVVRTGGTAPDGGKAVTLFGRGLLAEDIVLGLVRKGINLRPYVEVRVDRSPRTQVEQWGGSPMGVLWQGRGTLKERLSTTTPVPGVYAAGAHANPGAGIPFVGLSAALVAQEVGPA
ncbi:MULTISPECIES: phytoene desaturase family protein [unclassified Nocardioides]|uniref:phytoene desaturase family protein n=1 Tax=unclassified Nocardioides TaxID=2615069 RepID=UPI0006F845B9|nr:MULTISPECIES: NAD(P)/FAD-dependent oxidoreductase [unclassified Nocardioides]KQY63960.1 UDP-galactopyranose mutase [Nocardioides sp. Root140]KQZ69878.1 UDP-galactopyranose mutase [Nocardioides sp. Root151]KRF15974.1 UDP-galactopyranose mutase [Nocardioides sp. Soil796]